MFLAVAGAVVWVTMMWTSADLREERLSSEPVVMMIFMLYVVTIFSTPYVSYSTRKDWLLFNSD